MVPILFELLQGTPFLAMFFRLLGTKIGKRVLMDEAELYEFDLVEIENDVILNNQSCLQTHLFEDRIYKTGRIKVGKRCNVGFNGFLLYSSIMEEDSKLGNLSFLMKGEQLPKNTEWVGVPAQCIAQSQTNDEQRE